MCRAGLLTEEQLEHALSVQESSGRPLGEVIVRLGYASPGAVANALAEQHGGTLRTEYGVSSGLGRLPRAAPPPSPRPDDEAVAAAVRTAELAGLEERARAAEAQVAALEERAAEAERLRGRVTELESAVAAAVERAAEAERLRGRVTELESALEATREPEPRPETEHLLFVPSAAGYSLLRAGGPCPQPGRAVDVEGRALVVARTGPSPVGSPLRCAYLEPAP